MYSTQGIFQHHFQCKKVHTILDKIWYLHCNVFFVKTVSEAAHECADNSTSVLALDTSVNVAQIRIGSISFWFAKGGKGE